MPKYNYDQQYWIYRSPKGETSSHKGIPVKFLNDVKKKFPKGFTVAYRGKSKPGAKRPQQYVLKKNADTFAIYGLPKLPALKIGTNKNKKTNKKFRR